LAITGIRSRSRIRPTDCQHTTVLERTGAFDGPVAVLDAESHLGRHCRLRGYRRPNRSGNAMQQFGVVQQCRTAPVAIDQRRRTAEIEIDAGRLQFGQMSRVGRQ
jgi:hypothetical protein